MQILTLVFSISCGGGSAVDDPVVPVVEELCPDTPAIDPRDWPGTVVETSERSGLRSRVEWLGQSYTGGVSWKGGRGAIFTEDLDVPWMEGGERYGLGDTLHASEFLAASSFWGDTVSVWWSTEEEPVYVFGVDESLFGMQALGDLDGNTLIVGAKHWAHSNGELGEVFLFDAPLEDVQAQDADTILIGLNSLGYSVLGQDLDGDGIEDLLVGAPMSNTFRGAVTVFLGPVPTGVLEAEDADHWLQGQSYHQAGWSLAGGSDIDGDGSLDFAVGAVGLRDADLNSNGGAFWVLDWQASLEDAPRAMGTSHSGVGASVVLGVGPDRDLAAVGSLSRGAFVLRPNTEGTQLLCEADLFLNGVPSEQIGTVGAVDGQLWVAAVGRGNGPLYLPSPDHSWD